MKIANKVYEDDLGKLNGSTAYISKFSRSVAHEEFLGEYGNPYDTLAKDLQERFLKIWENGGKEAVDPYMTREK